MKKTLPQLIARFDERPSQLTAVRFKRDRFWVDWSWRDYQNHIEATSYYFKSKNLKAQDRILIFSSNRVEWALSDFAAQCLKVVVVPVYPNCPTEDLIQILEETQPALILVENEALSRKIPKSEWSKLILFDSSKEIELESFWPQLNSLLSEKSFLKEDFKTKSLEVHLEDLATIVYTSGTSGKPKGVGLTHRQMISELKDVCTAFPITSQDVTLSFLPYAHILGRVEMWLGAYAGFTLCFCESIEMIKKNLLETHPTVLIAVPRIFEKIYASVLSKMNSHPLQRLVHSMEKKGLMGSITAAPLRLLLKKQVSQQLRAALGGQLKYAISGGAPLAKEVSDFFKECEVLLLEGYGLTETTGAICANTPEHYQFGTVGRPLADVEIKLAADGEILVRSDKVFDHWLKSDQPPRDETGYFSTGDIGEWTKEGFLRITDRKKDLIKTSGGKYVAPQKIEGLFKQFPLISQSLIFGDQRKYIVALLTLSPLELKEFAFKQKIPFSRVNDLIHSNLVKQEVEDIVKKINSHLVSYESVKRFHILEEELTIENGELTPSLKIKRNFCSNKYKKTIEQLYGI